MLSRQQVEDLVLGSLVTLNKEKKDGQKIPVSSDTVLLGSGSMLDSLDFVVVVTNIEEQLQARMGVEVQVGADLQSIGEGNPFRTVASLNDHIVSILESGKWSG